jgi:mRNA-degrading endonuclease RelE of RelBE toxin-antitoxin system
MSYEVRFSRVAYKDVGDLTPRLKKKLKDIITGQIALNPHSGKRLVGDLAGFYSMRLTFKDRIIYSIDEEHKTVYIHRARTHYGE